MEELAPYMWGWRNYFGFCETPQVLIALTRWVRLRLRAALWRQWKTPRRRRAALVANGVATWAARNTAGSGRGPWYLARSRALSRALKCVLQIARSPIPVPTVLAPLLEPPCTDPYARWCGRGGAAQVAHVRLCYDSRSLVELVAHALAEVRQVANPTHPWPALRLARRDNRAAGRQFSGAERIARAASRRSAVAALRGSAVRYPSRSRTDQPVVHDDGGLHC